jgi:hypothetical protein
MKQRVKLVYETTPNKKVHSFNPSLARIWGSLLSGCGYGCVYVSMIKTHNIHSQLSYEKEQSDM